MQRIVLAKNKWHKEEPPQQEVIPLIPISIIAQMQMLLDRRPERKSHFNKCKMNGLRLLQHSELLENTKSVLKGYFHNHNRKTFVVVFVIKWCRV